MKYRDGGENYVIMSFIAYLLEKLTVPQLVLKIPAVCGTCKFIDVFTVALQMLS
jgi:hypothetical protein